MKKLTTITMLAVAALGFQACNSGTKDSTKTADSTNTAKVDSTKKDTSKTSGDSSAKTTTSNASIAVGKDDADFAVKAADGGMAEVAYAKVALQKATSPKVKEFAQMMITDHTKANMEMMALAKTKNITLPTAPSAEHQKMVADASAKSGADFDKKYVDDMVADHKEDVSLFKKASTDCKDADLKAFATKTLPVLQSHLDHINAIKSSMK